MKEARPAEGEAAPAIDTSDEEALLVSVVPIRSTGTKRPFFYSHVHIDGGAFYCFTLADRLGPDQPFYILEPHRFDTGRIPTSLQAMAGEYIRSMRTVQPHGPYLLGGFCGGGLIVFEMAHRLRQQGEEVDLLLLVEPVDGPGPASYRMVLRNFAGGFVRKCARLLRLGWQQQLDWFLRMRHYYVLLRYPYYRKRATHWLNPGKEEFISKRECGEKQAEALEREVHLIPGNHWTCRTDYIADYASSLNDCVALAQIADPE